MYFKMRPLVPNKAIDLIFNRSDISACFLFCSRTSCTKRCWKKNRARAFTAKFVRLERIEICRFENSIVRE